MRFTSQKNPNWLSLAAQLVTFEVLNLNDSGPGSLRQAILDANAAAHATTIIFKPGLTGTITLTSGQLKILATMRIIGPGGDTIEVSGGTTDRVLYLKTASDGDRVTISGLVVTDGNAGANPGGGIRNFNADLILADVTVQDSVSNQGGGIDVAPPGTLAASNVTITGNSSSGNGGGIYFEDGVTEFTIADSVISDNAATVSAGGIRTTLNSTATGTIERTTISGNQAGYNGGGLYCNIYDTGALTVRQSTISGNSAGGTSGGGACVYEYGGSLLLENSTISGNSLPNPSVARGGGGILISGPGPATAVLSLSTITNNSAPGEEGGGVAQRNGSTVSLSNTIVAGNSAGANNDIVGTLAGNYALVQDPGTATLTGAHNITGSDPLLSALANNGGPTETHLPSAISPVINAGDPAFTPPPTTDQRGTGFPRVKGGRVDIGAVER